MTPEQLDALERAHLAEKEAVRRLGATIGYGNMITLARALWAEMLAPSLGEETAKNHTETWGCDCADPELTDRALRGLEAAILCMQNMTNWVPSPSVGFFELLNALKDARETQLSVASSLGEETAHKRES